MILTNKVLVALSLLYPFISPASAQLSDVDIQLESGPARGFANTYRAGVTTWYGVPYGATTGGQNRWRPPQPVVKWNETRYFTSHGDICPDTSNTGSSNSFGGGGPSMGGSDSTASLASMTWGSTGAGASSASSSGTSAPANSSLVLSSSSNSSLSSPISASSSNVSEDCLNLNIWSGANSPSDSLPVYVWYHPAYASGNDAMFDGSALAAQGLVVVVVNHRQAVMGFLAHPWLTEESGGQNSGNYAFLDMIEVLRWTQRNIAAFGGDPNRVTIGGQSAGSADTNIMAMSNLTKGLFHGAIIESGIRFPNDTYLPQVAAHYYDLDVAETKGQNFTDSHNITSLEQLRNATLEELFTEYSNVEIPAVTVKDGYVMPKSYWESLVDGYPNDVPIITGNAADESGSSTTETTTLEAWIQDANNTYGVHGLLDTFLKLYPADNATTAAAQHNANATDTSVVGDWEFAKYWRAKMHSPFYTYFWTHAPPGQDQGAYHESEIYYAFNSLEANSGMFEWTDTDYLVADQMSLYWANFIKTGSPNGLDVATGINLTYWPPTSDEAAGQATVFNIDEVCQSISIASADKIAFLQQYWGYQTPL